MEEYFEEGGVIYFVIDGEFLLWNKGGWIEVNAYTIIAGR